MSLTVSYGCWLSFTVSPSVIELLHVSHRLVWLLAFSHCLSGPIELLHVYHCLLWLLTVSHSLLRPMELLHVPHILLSLLGVSI